MSDKRAEPMQARAGETYSIKGGSDVMWGVTPTSTLGTITNLSIDESAEFEPVPNQQGAITGIVIYDTKTEVKMTVIAAAEATMPTIGSVLAVDTVTGVVMSTSKASEYKGLKKFEVTVTKWANLTVSAG